MITLHIIEHRANIILTGKGVCDRIFTSKSQESKVEIKRHEAVHGGKPAGYAEGTVVYGAKGFVFLSGVVGEDETGMTPLGLEAQCRNAWKSIIKRLEKVGTSVENICHVFTFVVGSFPHGIYNDPKSEATSRVRREVWKEHYGPEIVEKTKMSATLIGVTALAHPEWLVEIQVIAAIP